MPKNRRTYGYLRLIVLACGVLVFLAVASQPTAADSTVQKRWQPDSCNDLWFDFELEYSSGELSGVTFTISTSYAGTSNKFTLPVSDGVEASVTWQTLVNGQTEKITKGIMTLKKLSVSSGVSKWLVYVNFDFYCTPEFTVSNKSVFSGIVLSGI